MKYTLKKLCNELKVKFSGNENLELTHVCGLDNLVPGGVGFLNDPSGLDSIPVPEGVHKKKDIDIGNIATHEVAMVVSKGVKSPSHNLIYSDDPLHLHVKIASLLHPLPKADKSIHDGAVIGNNVDIGDNVTIDANVVIYDDVKIGNNTILRSGVVIMEKSVIGNDCILYPNVVVCNECIIGANVIIYPNAVIGSDGHGYYQREGINYKIPQVGRVIIEDDVEIGACTTIDRGRLEDTIIGKGTKIDNHVQIAHNVEVGEQSLLSAHCAIGGSAKTGHHLIMGGQGGIRDNIKIGNGVIVGPWSAVSSNTKDGTVLLGIPAIQADNWKRNMGYISNIDRLFNRVKKLEKIIKEYEAEK